MANPIKVVKAIGRAVGGITGKGAKQVNPVYRNINSSVKVVPNKTAPKTGLENRGAKLTKSQKSERASELYFDKAEKRWEGEYMTRMTGLRGPKGVTSQATRGQGKKSLRKDSAIKKEAKSVIKINSALPKRRGK